jgi:DNA-binding beta-propeller fold protein YncE
LASKFDQIIVSVGSFILATTLILLSFSIIDTYAATDPFDLKEKKRANSLTFELVDKFGTTGSGEGEFMHPSSIDIDNKEKTLFVADLENNRIQKLGLDGEFITEWGSLGIADGQFNEPGDVAVDSTGGFVYVTDINNNRIQKFDTEGNFLEKWGSTGTGEGQFDHPGDIAVDKSGTYIYVTDIDNNRILKFDNKGNFITEWGTLGQGEGEFNSPAGMTISQDGTIYVSDTVNNRIQLFDEEGTFLGKWGTLGDNANQLNRPDGITTDSDGQIVYVSDRQNKRIQIFDSKGNYLTQIESLGTLAGQFGKPRDVAVDLLNRIYVVDKDNNNIQVFAPGKGTKSVQSVSDNKNDGEQSKNDDGEQKDVQKEFVTDPNSPTRHGKSYFTETFESEEDDPVFVLSHSTKKDKIFKDTIYDIVGEIKNTSDEEVTFVKIIATFYDDNGIVIGTDFTYTDPSDINPSRTAPYTLSIGFGDSIDVNDIAEAKYHLEWD